MIQSFENPGAKQKKGKEIPSDKRKERSLNRIHQFSMESINPKYPNQNDEFCILKCSDPFDESRLISSRFDLLFVCY